MKRIPGRIFHEEFKREAIKRVNDQGLTIAEAYKKSVHCAARPCA